MQVVGVACLFPDCLFVIPRDTGPGAPKWHCPKHWTEARERRSDLLKEIGRIEHILDTTPNNTRGVDRRALQSDLQYLRRALVAYPEVNKIRPEAADRTSRRRSESVRPDGQAEILP